MKITLENGWVSISGDIDAPQERFEIAFYCCYESFPDDEVPQRIYFENGNKVVSWLWFPVAV